MKIRIGSMNVENLFSRAKVLNLETEKEIGETLKKVARLQTLIQKEKYTDANKKEIVSLNNELKEFIEIQEDRGKLFKKKNQKITGVSADGRNDWDGQISFKRESFSEMTRENTAKVLKSLKPDILAVIEAEDLPTLRRFRTNLLSGVKLPHIMLVDGFDPRGIDVGVYSKYPITNVVSHIDDKAGTSTIFSRDCPEYTIDINGKPLYILVNHLKSKGYGVATENDAKRKRQATRIAEILKKYDLKKDMVVVAGDMNDTPDSATLAPLLNLNNLYDVLDLQFKNDVDQKWTYHFKKFEQIDYVLVSKPLKEAFVAAGVERRGIFKLSELTNGLEFEYDTVTSWRNAASDHGAIWSEFDI